MMRISTWRGGGWHRSGLLVAALWLVALTLGVSSAEAATFTVNTADDAYDGACSTSHCSLREAIDATNDASDADTIRFAIPGDGPHTITVESTPAWWRLQFPVVIDGTTQPGYAGMPVIELDGSLSTPRQQGLAFFGGASTVRGLAINRFKGIGIELQQRGGYVIEANHVGTDPTGTVDLGNGESGIHVICCAPATRPELANHGNRIVDNVISGNGGSGILLANDRSVIQGNHIGTDASGTVALGNGGHGIRIANTASDNVIGGTAPGEGNVISANGIHGIENGGACNPCVFERNAIQGNRIGTNASGSAALGNRLNGISSIGNRLVVGGTVAAARNVISGNGWNGIFISGRATGSVVQGNLIGTAADGTTALGNGLANSLNRNAGIDALQASDTTIGGTAAGAANTIAFSTGPGVAIGASSGDPTFSRNAVLSNSIHSNGALGIELRPPGVNRNDPGDGDRGPNELQNFPVLTSASGNSVNGTLNSLANTRFRLEFFANSAADPSGHGEGERFLGSKEVTTDASGNASFSFTSATSFDGRHVSATATDPANNTSEFSGTLFVPAETRSPTLTLAPATATNDVGDEDCVTATVRDGSGNPMASVTVRFSAGGANRASGSATTASNGAADFCYVGTSVGVDTITAYADIDSDSVQGNGEPADTAHKTWVAAAPSEPGPYLLLIDESSIDNGTRPNFFSATDVNDPIARLAQRTPLPAFDAANLGRSYALHTGEVGNEGWFAPKTIPEAWATAGPTGDGIRNFVGNPREPYPHNVGPGLGTADAKGDRESLLDKVPDVTPLRATALGMLAERRATICAAVYDSTIGINYGPLSGSLKGANLGTVAFRVVSSRPLVGHSSGSLPEVGVEVLDAGTVCEQPLQLFTDAPAPQSSSQPYDTGRTANG